MKLIYVNTFESEDYGIGLKRNNNSKSRFGSAKKRRKSQKSLNEQEDEPKSPSKTQKIKDLDIG